MALDPNIALGVRPIELPNQLAQYGMLSQIQNAQQANRLHEMQMAEYERARAEEENTRNFLGKANLTDPSVRAQLLIGYGKSGREIYKNLTEADKARSEEAARQSKLAQDTQTMYQNMSGQIGSKQDATMFLQRMLNDPAMKDAPITKIPLMEQVRRIPDDPKGLDNWIKQFSLGATKYITENKPHFVNQDTGAGGRTLSAPGLGGDFSVVPGSEFTKTMTFADRTAQRQADIAAQRANTAAQQLALDRQSVVYQPNAEGGVTAFPAKLSPGEVPRGRTAVAGGPGMQPFQGKPSETEGKEIMSINQQKSTVQGALDAVKATPDAFGWTTGNLPESVRSRLATSPENEARAFVFNVVSGVIKERAGTAQSAGEAATLARFLPAEGDNAKVIEDKLTGFQKYLNAKESGTTKKRSGDASAKPAAANPYSAMSNEDLLKALRGN